MLIGILISFLEEDTRKSSFVRGYVKVFLGDSNQRITFLFAHTLFTILE